MYDFELHQTASGNFEVAISIPNPPKVVLGVDFPMAATTVRVSEAKALQGEFNGLDFETEAEKIKFTKAVGKAIHTAKGHSVYVHP